MPTAQSVQNFGQSWGGAINRLQQAQQKRKREELIQAIINKTVKTPIKEDVFALQDPSSGLASTEKPMYDAEQRGIMEFLKYDPGALASFASKEMTPQTYKPTTREEQIAFARDKAKATREINPTTILSMLELKEIAKQLGVSPEELGAEETNVLPTGKTETIRPTGITGVTDRNILPTKDKGISLPSDYIEVPTGRGKYGQVETKFELSPESKIKQESEKLTTEAGAKAEGKRIEESSKANVNFEKAVNLFSGIIAQVKGQGEEQGGLGLMPGLKGAFRVAIKDPEFSRTASAYGQRAETAFAMNSILTGQNRVIKGVVNMILRSLPGQFDPDTVAAAKVAQSVRNSFMITRAFEQAGITQDVLNKMSQDELDNLNIESMVAGIGLSKEDEAFLEARINAVLSTPVAKQRTLLDRSVLPERPNKTSSGLKYTIEE